MARRASGRRGGGAEGLDYEALNRRVLELHERARPRDAQAIYRKVLRDANPRALAHFGRVAARYHAFDMAAKLLERAIACGAADADTHNEAGLACLHAGRSEDALRLLHEAARLEPGDYRCRANLALVHQEEGDLDEALAVLAPLLESHPDVPSLALRVGELQLRRGEPEAALAQLDAVLEGKPHPTWPLALRSIALCELGESERFHELMRYPEFARCLEASAPPGFEEIAAFNAQLRKHLVRHRTLARNPEGYSTRNGRHSLGNLLRDRSPVIEGMERLIHAAVDAYAAALPPADSADPADAHPFLARAERFRIEAWAVVLERQGYHASHVHRDGWLSGVYYVCVDEVVREDDPGYEGWLELGRGPGELYGLGSEPETELVRPRSGHFQLFPSFCWHRTRPFEAKGERVAVAFDVIPAG
ncbi:MAG: putative 2OG-Fe(II) oxygenase [Myxococcota bacterium]